jgi:hypothetical protein
MEDKLKYVTAWIKHHIMVHRPDLRTGDSEACRRYYADFVDDLIRCKITEQKFGIKYTDRSIQEQSEFIDSDQFIQKLFELFRILRCRLESDDQLDDSTIMDQLKSLLTSND